MAPAERDGREPAEAGNQQAPIELEELRRLIVGRERDDLERVRYRLDQLTSDAEDLGRVLPGAVDELAELRRRLDELSLEAKDVGRVLPQAIGLRTRQDGQLADALTPTIEGAIESSVKRNPTTLANAIFPLMGPAIRKSIREALASVVEGINRTLEHSLSPRGIRWRIEAMRTGRPFAEVVLKHSLIFRVDEVFLIHRETSLLLQHVAGPGVVQKDPDMISSMLGAIQDFVSDSFSDPDQSGIAQVEFGELLLEVARGPYAVLACVVRGVAPTSLRGQVQETLEQVHADLGRELREFEGDDTPFVVARTTMERLLLEERAQARGKRSKKKPVLAALLLSAVIVGGASWIGARYFTDRGHEQTWATGESVLDTSPGIVLTTSRRDGGQLVYGGLRDPLAEEPRDLLRDAGLSLDDVTLSFTPYVSLEPQFVLERARARLSPPEGVSLHLEGTRLELSGSATAEWALDAVERARGLPGIEEVSVDGLSEVPE